MSDTDNSPAPRRSQREKRQTQTFAGGGNSPSKRKRGDDGDDDDDQAGLDDGALVDADVDDDDDVEGDYRAPTKKAPGATRKPKAPKGPTPAKKSRAGAGASKPTARRGRKNAVGDVFDAEQVAKESKIANDNPLFKALMNPNAALQTTAEDFLDSLSVTPNLALADLINCVLRCCGCNEVVDADAVVDYDGVVDALDNFTENLKQDDTPMYPLTSKLPVFKHFRKSLTEFIDRLVSSAADLGTLYSSDLLSTLQTWIIAMSTSQIRSFRHTATVIALDTQTALCDVAAAVQKETEMINKQRDGERKKKAKGGTSNREKEFATKAAEVKERRTKMTDFLKEFFDGVFIHRYRDLDPNIRADCVRSLGLWFKKHPSHYIEGTYLRYVGWVLSDKNTHVRLEAVKALQALYARQDFLVSLTHFTERFRPRLVEMASGDVELAVRVAVIQVLGAMDGHGLLEETEQEMLCLLVYDKEAKVRKAVSGFVRGIWEEAVESHLVGAKVDEKDKERVGIKILASLLVKWDRTLDGSAEKDAENDDSSSSQDGQSAKKEVASLVGSAQKGRAALAVEALWDEVPPIGDWEALLEVLLLDHTAGDDTVSRRNKNKKAADDTTVNKLWRLEEVEETVLLEVFIAALVKAKTEVENAKKGEDENVMSDITRALIKGLPRLMAKHQSDENRLCDILAVPQLMNLEMYLEMRMITAYEALWDDVSKQFLSHSSLVVLRRATATIQHFMRTTSLSNTNSAKIVELEDELATSLRDIVAGRDELEVTTFSEDESETLAAICARVASLSGIRDISAWMEEDEGGKQSSAWDILAALSDRGRLGYREEEKMVDQALQVMKAHVMWKRLSLHVQKDAPDREQIQDALREQRETLLEKVMEYAVGTQSNTSDVVKRTSFQTLLDLHILFSPSVENAAEELLNPFHLTLEDEVQYRCAGFVQAEIERYSEELADDERGADGEVERRSDSDGDNEQTPKRKLRKGDGAQHPPRTRADLEREYIFTGIIANFMRAIRSGIIHPRHGAVLLAHYGRLGVPYDICCKVVVDVLREQGFYLDHGDVVAEVITQALEQAFTLVIDALEPTEDHAVALSKLLASCLVLRGSQLSILKRLNVKHVVDIHTTCLSWIGKRLALYEQNKNKKARSAAALFFKCLVPLLGQIGSSEALTVKAHLDNILAQAKIEVAATSKVWEPLRAYERRLGTIIAKGNKGSGTKSKKPRGKKVHAGTDGEAATTDDDDGGEVSEVENIIDEWEDVAGPASKPKAKPRPRAAFGKKVTATDDNEDIDEGGAVNATPTRAPRSQPQSQRRTPKQSQTLSQSQAPSTRGAKRRRDDDDDVEGDDSDALEGAAMEIDDDGTTANVGAPHETQTNEVQFRRKRIRH